MSQVILLDRLGWEGIQRIKLLRRNIKKMWRTDRICRIISVAVEREFGLGIQIGFREGRGHWWNVWPDGTLLDCSADQFGDDAILAVPVHSDKFREYQVAPRHWVDESRIKLEKEKLS